MQAHIIVKNGYEYNDEYYEQHDMEAELEAGSTSQDWAQTECDRLNGKLLREQPDLCTEDGQVIQPYKVISIEIREAA